MRVHCLELFDHYPEVKFVAGGYFMYSPAEDLVVYDLDRLTQNDGKLALLHEIGHAKLGHKMYKYDIELLSIEVAAWDYVRENAQNHAIQLDEDHISACIASYDHWLVKRATCPECQNFSLQRGRDFYGCFLCGTQWTVNWRKDRRVKRTRHSEQKEYQVPSKA